MFTRSFQLVGAAPSHGGLTRPRTSRVTGRRDTAHVEPLEERRLLSSVLPLQTSQEFTQTNLVSDGAVAAAVTDPNLVNPWGLAASPTGPFWIADNGMGVSTAYNGDGTKVDGTVTIPPPASTPDATSAPTGAVFNPTNQFKISANSTTAASRFIFVTEDGTIAGWNPSVDATNAVQVVDNSANGAVYKGATLARNQGKNYLYAADFSNGRIDVFNKKFQSTTLAGDFTDASIPTGFAPFNIQLIGKRLFVTFAMQDANKTDDVAGAGNGFVDEFRKNGTLVRRFASQGTLDSPWGMTRAPANFGAFSNDLLVGNFGDGRINAFNPATGQFIGQLQNDTGQPLTIDGLWSLRFGNGTTAASRHSLFFTAGPNEEADGLFGKLDPASPTATAARAFAVPATDATASPAGATATSVAPNSLLA